MIAFLPSGKGRADARTVRLNPPIYEPWSARSSPRDGAPRKRLASGDLFGDTQEVLIESSAMAKLTPREIEIRIGQLIHASLNGRSTAIATEIVRHIEALCAHPDDRRSPEERCVLRHLAGHWRRLAWITVELVSRNLYFAQGGLRTEGRAFALGDVQEEARLWPGFTDAERSVAV